MTVAQLLALLVGVLGGAGGFATVLRVRAQNRADEAAGRRTDAEAEAIEVRTARELIAEVRAEMDRRVAALTHDVGRLQGRLDEVVRERDDLHSEGDNLRRENANLRTRVGRLERRVRDLTVELASTGATPPPDLP